MISLSDLHDSSLLEVLFEWEAARAYLILKTGVRSLDIAVITVEGVTDLRFQKLQPWGPSTSVNSAVLEKSTDAERLVVQMQSGDNLEICCTAIKISTTLPAALVARWPDPKDRTDPRV